MDGQVVIDLRLLGEDIDDVGPTDKLVAVYVRVASQFLDPGIGLLEHPVLGPDGQGPRNTGLDARWRFIAPEAVIAQVALGDLVRRPVVTGDVEGAGGDALFAADAAGRIQPHGPEFRMIKGPARTDLHTGRIGTVHAALFPEEPIEGPFFIYMLLKANQGPRVPLEFRGVLVGARLLRSQARHLVPLLTRHLTAAAGGALRRIDQFYEFSIHRLSS